MSSGAQESVQRIRVLLVRGVALCAGVMVAAGWFVGCMSERRGPRPLNVLLITIDTLRADHLGCYGYERDTTPNLDRLATESILFQDVACEVPITLPSHCSILTGLYPQTHGVRSNGTYRLTEEHVTLAEILREEGYRTGAVVSAFCLAGRFGISQGFDFYDERFSAPLVPGIYPSASGGKPEEFTRDWLLYRYRQPYQKRADEVTEIALDVLKRDDNTPFFLWLHYFDPHAPYAPPEPYFEMFYEGHKSDPSNTTLKDAEILEYMIYPNVTDREYYVAQYDGEIRYTDEQIGRVLAFLEGSGLKERTLVIVTADHGESLGEHGHYFNHGNAIYEPSVKVPLLIYLPDGNDAGSRVKAPAALIDLFPTVLDLLGIRSSQPVQGRSLATLLDGTQSRSSGRYLETIQPEFKQPGGMLRGLLKGQYKYIRTDGLLAPGGIRRELYDLHADPKELENLADAEPEKVEGMENELLQLAALGIAANQESAVVDLTSEDLDRLRSIGYFDSGSKTVAVNVLDLRMEEALRAIRMNPGNAEAHLSLAEAYVRQGMMNQAIEEYEAVLRIKSDHHVAMLRLARAYAEEDQWDLAAGQYEKLIQQRPESVEPYVELSRIYVQQKRWAEAISLLESASPHASQNPLILLALGNCWASRNDLEKAAAYWQKALELDPSFEPALSNLKAIGRRVPAKP